MHWEVIENHTQGVYKACNIYHWPYLVDQTGIIKSDPAFFGFLIYYCFYAMFISLFVCVVCAQMVYLQMHIMFFPWPCFRLKIYHIFFKPVHMYFLFVQHSYMLGSS